MHGCWKHTHLFFPLPSLQSLAPSQSCLAKHVKIVSFRTPMPSFVREAVPQTICKLRNFIHFPKKTSNKKSMTPPYRLIETPYMACEVPADLPQQLLLHSTEEDQTPQASGEVAEGEILAVRLQVTSTRRRYWMLKVR